MRVAMVAQWLRAAKADPRRRSACLTYAATITVAQIGWIAMVFVHTSLWVTFVWFGLLIFVELLGPLIAEFRTVGTPWHAHHITERYGLLTIIALGECVVGTVASLSAIVTAQGWSVGAMFIALAGVGLTFGMWWIYYTVPMAELLHAHRRRSFAFGYLPLATFGSIVATGAGLHVAAYYIEHQSKLGSAATVLSVAIPVAAYIASLYLLYLLLAGTRDAFHLLLVALTAAVLVASVALAAAGVSTPVCLLLVMLAPVVSVVGFELLGHRHAAEAVNRSVSGQGGP
jgi:low temperature requirement protein LtrA